ncbi:MAG: trehalose utilization protein ThuA, partial [Spirochaetia bacterium]|nr:trehalose utilization protein ThuA [Spirochaetia bacterium]
MSKISVTVWHEYVHEKAPGEKGKIVSQIYPQGIHNTIADDLKKTPEYEV